MTTIGYANVGASGAIFIDDDGYYIRAYARQNDSQTYINSPGKDWALTVNGVNYSGKWTWAKGGGDRLIAGPVAATYSQTVSFAIGATGTQGFGAGGSVSGWAARATVPGTPGTPSASEISPTSMRLSWAIPGNGGAAIDQMLLRRSTDPNFGSYTDFPQGGNVSTAVVSGLTPGTNYYWRVYAHNAVGYSASSGILTQATLPATAPGLFVLPSIDGASASATLTPPGGASGVTKYTVERRVLGTTVPVVTTESPASPIAQSPLIPGTSYEYRAKAWFGTYESPWSDWVGVVQPNPNTDPGGYFDGNTTDTPALDYGWTGTAGASTSTATGLQPTGWKDFASSAQTSGGTGAVFRALGGFQGQFAARAVFFTDSTAYGFAFGTSDAPLSTLADIEGGADYVGSIYAYPSKSQRLRAAILWRTQAGAFISTSVGAEVEVGTAGARLTVSATAPANAQWASVVVQNVAGTGGSLWLGGDWLQLDAAMMTLQAIYPYFDGNTPDTAQYRYDWLGAANASASMRTTLADSEIDPLLDPDCAPIPSPPQPPIIDDDCIDEVGTWRRYWAVIPEEEVYEWLSVVPTTTITTGAVAARQVRVRYYPNPEGLPPSAALDLEAESEQVITYIPPNTVMTLDAVSETVYAAVDGQAQRNADHLLRGSNGLPATWPVLSCGGSYLVSFDVPLDAPVGNIVVGASLTTRRM